MFQLKRIALYVNGFTHIAPSGANPGGVLALNITENAVRLYGYSRDHRPSV